MCWFDCVCVFRFLSYCSFSFHFYWKSCVRDSINKMPYYIHQCICYDQQKWSQWKSKYKTLKESIFNALRSAVQYYYYYFSIYYILHIIIYIYDHTKHWLVLIANSFSWFLSSCSVSFYRCCCCFWVDPNHWFFHLRSSSIVFQWIFNNLFISPNRWRLFDFDPSHWIFEYIIHK